MELNDELLKVIRRLAEANEELIQVAEKGDRKMVAELLNRVSLLEGKRNNLVNHNAKFSQQRLGTGRYESAVPLRDQVIRALHLLSRPATGRLLADVTRARWNERIETAKLSSLRRDESRSWFAGQDRTRRTAIRDVYVVPALSFDRFAPVRGTLALSTWETARRLVAPLSPRVDMLKSTISLAREADRLAGTKQADPMRRLVGKLGASIPGVHPFGVTTQELISAANAELSELEEVDSIEREEAANRAVQNLSADALLFGAPLRSVKRKAGGG